MSDPYRARRGGSVPSSRPDERPPQEAFDPHSAPGQSEFPCAQCGAVLAYAPGTEHIACRYCGHENEIPKPPVFDVEEQDYQEGLAKLREEAPAKEVEAVKCDSCSAQFRWTKSTHADDCPFCGAPIVVNPKTARPLQPNAVLPFQIDEPEARGQLKKWLGSLWFAPGDARKVAFSEGRLTGVYVPFWTYDADTESDYSGEQGIMHTKMVPVTDAQGRTTMVTETEIIWTPVSGHVARSFDDVVVLASPALPEKYANRLRTWNLGDLKPYQEQYLAGYQSELYQLDLDDGYAIAKSYMEKVIYRDVCMDIGGHQQRVHHISSRFHDITFKHVLLPIWSNAYRYRGKRYQYLVNGQTGEVQGERPWSWVRISLAVLVGLIILGGIIWAIAASEGGAAY